MTRRRHRPVPQRNPHHLAGDHALALHIGWCANELDLEETKTLVHDALIAQMGDARTGGVTWHIYDGTAAVGVICELLALPDNDESLADDYLNVAQHLRDDGGILVVATAPGVAP